MRYSVIPSWQSLICIYNLLHFIYLSFPTAYWTSSTGWSIWNLLEFLTEAIFSSNANRTPSTSDAISTEPEHWKSSDLSGWFGWVGMAELNKAKISMAVIFWQHDWPRYHWYKILALFISDIWTHLSSSNPPHPNWNSSFSSFQPRPMIFGLRSDSELGRRQGWVRIVNSQIHTQNRNYKRYIFKLKRKLCHYCFQCFTYNWSFREKHHFWRIIIIVMIFRTNSKSKTIMNSCGFGDKHKFSKKVLNGHKNGWWFRNLLEFCKIHYNMLKFVAPFRSTHTLVHALTSFELSVAAIGNTCPGQSIG